MPYLLLELDDERPLLDDRLELERLFELRLELLATLELRLDEDDFEERETLGLLLDVDDRDVLLEDRLTLGLCCEDELVRLDLVLVTRDVLPDDRFDLESVPLLLDDMDRDDLLELELLFREVRFNREEGVGFDERLLRDVPLREVIAMDCEEVPVFVFLRFSLRLLSD